MLIDTYLPQYDVRERHRTHVAASPAATYAALRTADFAAHPLVRVLFALRALPGALARGADGIRALWKRRPEVMTVATLEASGFRVLEDAPPTELVLGIEGQFWRSVARTRTPDVATFRMRAPAPGTARGVMNFRVHALDDRVTEVTTETRVQCADAAARRRFLPYWFLIRPASGIIRHAMLRSIKRAAEATRERPA
jgi:hypothetical protein